MKSFDEPRLQYLKDHPFPSELHDVLVSDRIPKAEVLRRLEKAGAKIPERTLAFYANQGLIEKPLIASRKTGQGRESYFTVNVIERIKTIKKYQSEGHSLEEIRDRILSPDKIRRLCDKAQKSHDGKADDLYQTYFIGLANVLIENLPTADEMRGNWPITYLSLAPASSSKILRLSRAIAERANEIKGKREDLDKILAVLGTVYPEKAFASFFDSAWEKALSALFLEITQSVDREFKKSIALLSSGYDRTLVLIEYYDLLDQMYYNIMLDLREQLEEVGQVATPQK